MMSEGHHDDTMNDSTNCQLQPGQHTQRPEKESAISSASLIFDDGPGDLSSSLENILEDKPVERRFSAAVQPAAVTWKMLSFRLLSKQGGSQRKEKGRLKVDHS